MLKITPLFIDLIEKSCEFIIYVVDLRFADVYDKLLKFYGISHIRFCFVYKKASRLSGASSWCPKADKETSKLCKIIHF